MSLSLILLLSVLGEPDGWSRQEIALPGDVWAVIPADEDGDGLLDLVIAHGSSGGQGISVLRQTRSGFPDRPQESWRPPGGAMALVVEDLEPGGGAEVATIHRKGIYLHTPRADGEGRAFTRWKEVESFFTTPPGDDLPRWNLSADLDGDSLTDLIIPTEDGYRIIRSDPHGGSPSPGLQVATRMEIDPMMPSQYRGLLFASRSILPRLVERDLDGDGLGDLAFLQGGALRGFLRGKEGAFPERPDVSEELLPIQKLGAGAIGRVIPRLADMTGDGVADLIVTRVIGEVGLFETLRTHIAIFDAKGPGRFGSTPSQIVLVKGVSIDPRLFDYDRDGDLDLFVSALRTDLLTNIKNVVIRWVTVTYHGYLNKGDGRFALSPSLSWDVEIPVRSIEQGKTVPLAWFQGDFNGDGVGDVLAVGGPERTTAYPGVRDGDEYEFDEDKPIFDLQGAASDGVEITDLTGDGRSDVIMRFLRGPERARLVLILSPRAGGGK